MCLSCAHVKSPTHAPGSKGSQISPSGLGSVPLPVPIEPSESVVPDDPELVELPPPEEVEVPEELVELVAPVALLVLELPVEPSVSESLSVALSLPVEDDASPAVPVPSEVSSPSLDASEGSPVVELPSDSAPVSLSEPEKSRGPMSLKQPP